MTGVELQQLLDEVIMRMRGMRMRGMRMSIKMNISRKKSMSTIIRTESRIE